MKRAMLLRGEPWGIPPLDRIDRGYSLASARRGPGPELLFAGAYSACYHGALINAAKKVGTSIEIVVREVQNAADSDDAFALGQRPWHDVIAVGNRSARAAPRFRYLHGSPIPAISRQLSSDIFSCKDLRARRSKSASDTEGRKRLR